MKIVFASISKLMISARPNEQFVALQNGAGVTWSTFYNNVSALTAALQKDPAIDWVVQCQDSLNFATALLALFHAGKHVLLPNNVQEETLKRLSSSHTKILADTLVPAAAMPVLRFSEGIAQSASVTFKELDPKTVSLTLFTSGSTGEPKLVGKKLIQIDTELVGLEKAWGKALGERVFYSTVVHQHIYGLLFRVLWPLCRGSVFLSSLITTPEELLPIDRGAANVVLASSPAFMKRLEELSEFALSSKNKFTVFSSGGLLAQSTSLAMQKIFGSCPIEVLGSTETGGVAYRTQENKNELWKPFPVVELSQDADGQLLVRSPYIAGSDFYPMGDAAEFFQGSDRFLLKGRIDKIVKIEEKRVSLTEIENRLAAHPYVEKAMALPLQGKRQIIGVVLILSAQGKEYRAAHDKKAMSDLWRDYLLKYFERVVLPRKWRYVDVFPVNEQGKIQQAALKELFT